MNSLKKIRSDTYISVGLFVVALLVRLLYLGQLFHTPLWVPMGDGKVYHEMAQAVASGQIIQKEAFYLHPLYPYLVGILYKFFHANILTVLVLQAMLDALSVVVIYRIGLRAFNRKVAFISASIYSLYQPAVYFTGTFLGVTLTIFLLLLGIYYFVDIRNENRFGKWFFCGFIFGLAALSQFTVILCAVGLVFCLVMQKKWIVALCLLTGSLVPFIPVTIHNYLAEKVFLPFTSHGGVTLYHTNHHGCGGFPEFGDFKVGNVELIHKASINIARKETGKMLSSGGVSEFWYKKTQEFIKQHPAEFLKFLWLRFTLFWNAFEIPSNYNIYFFQDQIPLLRWLIFNYRITAILFLSGLLFIFANLRRHSWLILVIGTYVSGMILVFVYARFRIIVVPYMLIVGALGVDHFLTFIKERSWKKIGLYVLALGTGFVITQNRIYSKEQFAAENYNALGYAEEQLKNYAEATEAYKKAVEADPDYALFYYNLGTAYLKRENYQEGENILKLALSRSPLLPEVFFNLGFAQEHLAKYDSAITNYERFLSLSHDTINVYFRLGVTYSQIKKWQDAEKYIQPVYEKTNDTECLFYLGICAGGKGDNAVAIRYLNKYIESNGIKAEEARKYLDALKK